MRRICLAVLLGLSAAAARAAPADAGLEREVYRLGYDVYLQRGNLAGAFLLASQALALAPDDTGWLRRYARVGEWVGQPDAALGAWLKLAQLTNSEEAWGAVARLAPALLNDEAMLAYQRHMVGLSPGDAQLIARMTQTCERLGRSDEALRFLQELNQRQPHRELLEASAMLAERMGDDQTALQAFDELIRRYGPGPDWVMRRALLRYNRGGLEQAWEEMHALERAMPAQAADFWRTYASFSTMLNHHADANHAYQVLLDSGQAHPADETAYVDSLQLDDSLAAARLSETLYRQHGRPRDLLTALFLYQRTKHDEAADKLLDSLSPEQLAAMQGSGEFLQERGELRWREMRLAGARQDFEQALRLQPHQQLRNLQALVGILEDQGDAMALQPLLLRYEALAQSQSALWRPWAAGWNLLQQPQRALPYLRRHCQANPDDSAAWLELARTYAALGDSGTAQGIRRRVLAAAGGQTPGVANAVLEVALDQAGAERGRQLLQTRLSASPADAGSRDVALGWLLRQGSDDAAQAWIGHAYQGDAPAWARLGLALRQQDQATLAQLLDSVPGRLPPLDAVAAASALGRAGSADSMAFEASALHPDSDEQQQQLQQLFNGRGDWLALGLKAERLGIVRRRQAELSWSGEYDPLWRWQLLVNRADLHSSDRTQLLSPSPVAERVSGLLSRRRPDSESSLLLARSSALTDYTSVAASQLWHVGTFSLRGSGSYNTQTDESAALLLGGMKDQLSLGLSRDAGMTHAGLQISDAAYFSQDRQRLGQGQLLSLEGGLALSTGREPQSLRLLASDATFHASSHRLSALAASLVPAGAPRSSTFYMPAGFEQVGLFWAIGDQAAQSASRRWQYFAELGPTYASSVGAGHELLAGVAGPLLGGDRLALTLEHARSGVQNGSLVERIGLDYRFFY